MTEPPHVHPGDTCPTCTRRVPYPKQASSPKTRPFSYRVPNDEYDGHKDVLDAAAEVLGIKDKPHHQFKLATYSATLILQGSRLTELGG